MCAPPHSQLAGTSFSLQEAETGGIFQIQTLVGAGCERLRQIGFCESMEVQKLSGGRNLICSLCGTRMALSRELASQVIVKPIVNEGI